MLRLARQEERQASVQSSSSCHVPSRAQGFTVSDLDLVLREAQASE